MLVKFCAYRIKLFQLDGWIISHGYYLMIFHSRLSDCEAHICGQCLINSRQLHDVMRKGRGGTSLVPRHLLEKLRGVWQHAHTMPCPREIQSIMQPCANVCVPMQSKLKVCTNEWLDCSINTKNYVSS